MTPDSLTFKRLQTDTGTSVTVFVAMDGTLADGTTITGDWKPITIFLTPDEQATAMSIVARAKQAYCDSLIQQEAGDV